MQRSKFVMRKVKIYMEKTTNREIEKIYNFTMAEPLFSEIFNGPDISIDEMLAKLNTASNAGISLDEFLAETLPVYREAVFPVAAKSFEP